LGRCGGFIPNAGVYAKSAGYKQREAKTQVSAYPVHVFNPFPVFR
jgi:hypothetical protein